MFKTFSNTVIEPNASSCDQQKKIMSSLEELKSNSSVIVPNKISTTS